MNSREPFTFPAPWDRGESARRQAPGRRARGLARLAAAAFGLVWLAGCMPNTLDAVSSPALRYPYVVESKVVTQPVLFQAGANTLDDAEKRRLDTYLARFFETGGDILEIRLTAAVGDQRSEDRLRNLRRYLLLRGAQRHELRLRRIVDGGVADGPIILSFENFTVKPIKCEQRNAPTAENPKNMQHPDWGCSTRATIAAMVLNPADLRQPRDQQPGDAMRRSRVLRNYRTGQPTEATRGDNETTNSIRDLGG